jgi:DNA-binding transcriptional MerR regulator
MVPKANAQQARSPRILASDRSYYGCVRYRIEELAERSGVTVDTVRFYQTRGLLPRPERDGRVAWYDDGHLERLERVRDLKARGFPLAIIARLLAGELDPQEEALAVALTEALPGDEERLSLAELSERTGVSPTLLEALEREGLLVGRAFADQPYTAADLDTVRAGLALLAAGIPLSELLALARAHDDAMRTVAGTAVDLFARYVYDPVRDAESGSSEQLVETLQYLLPAAEALVSHHFRRRLLAVAGDRLAR